MAAARLWLACAALAVCACCVQAHTHSAPRLASVAGAAPDATNTSKATGVFFVDLNDGQGAWNLTLRGVSASDVLTPSLHEAPAGAAGGTVGPEVVPLKANSTSTAGGAVVLEGTFSAGDYLGPLKGQPFDALHPRIHESQIYVVVPTKQHPAGEIKGPIRPEMLSE